MAASDLALAAEEGHGASLELLKHYADELLERVGMGQPQAGIETEKQQEYIHQAATADRGSPRDSARVGPPNRREEGKGQMKVQLEIAAENAKWHRLLEQVLAGKNQHGIRAIKENLEAFSILATVEDERAARAKTSGKKRA